MATRRYSIARGETEYNITEAVGAAVATKSMEFTFDLAANLTREDVLEALMWFENYIVSHNFPPA